MRQWRRWMAATLLVILAACGGSDDADQQPMIASAELGRAGGSLTTSSPTGGSLALELPADALSRDTVLTVEGLATEPGVLDRFAILPAGQLLLARATVRYTAAQTLPERAVLRWRVGARSVALPTTRQGNVLVARTAYLGYPFADAAAAGGARERALSARARPLAADAPAAVIEVAPMECDVEQARLAFLIASAASVGDEVQASALFDELQAILLTCQIQRTAELQQMACDAYGGAALLAQTTTVETYADLRAIAARLMSTRATVQEFGADCAGPQVDDLLAAKFAQFNVFLGAQFTRPSFASVEYGTARLELRRFYDYLAVCEHLGAGQVCQTMRETLFPDFFDRLREGVYRECRERGDALPLATMYAEDLVFSLRGQGLRNPDDHTGPFLDLGRFRYADLEADLAHCRSALTVTTFDDARGTPVQETSTELAGGFDPGSAPLPIEVEIARTGSLTLGGPVQALQCPDGNLGIDRLVARINGVEVDSRALNGPRFLVDSSPFDFVLSDALTRALLDPATVERFTLDLFREGDACQGRFARSFRLYTVEVRVRAIGLALTPASANVAPNANLRFTAQLSGTTSTSVEWTASAGTIDASGLFTAPAESGAVTITARATSLPGVSASATVTVGQTPVLGGRFGGTMTVTWEITTQRNTTQPPGGDDFFGGTISSFLRETASLTFDVEADIVIGAAVPLTLRDASSMASLEQQIASRQERAISGGCRIIEEGSDSTTASASSDGTLLSPQTVLLRADGSFTFTGVRASIDIAGTTQRRITVRPLVAGTCDSAARMDTFTQAFSAETAAPTLPVLAGQISGNALQGSATERFDASNPAVGFTQQSAATVTWSLTRR